MKVLVMEPPNQQLPIDTARPNGALGPAYLVGALRSAGIEADYYDGTVGWPGDPLEETFYNRTKQENGTIRYGASLERLAQVISKYDVVATSSIFTAQTRMHFEIAELVKSIQRQGGNTIFLVSGGVNAIALRTHFIDAGFDHIETGEGEFGILETVRALGGDPIMPLRMNRSLDDLPLPALDALPLETYRTLGIPHAGMLPPGTKFASIQTSRGCQDRCTFCHISLEKERGQGFLRMFSKDYIHTYVDYAVSLGISRLYFEDDNLFFSKKRLYDLHPALKRTGLEYSNVNGGNLRFLFKMDGEVDTEFIAMLADFGLVELTLPFESRNPDIMRQYATGKYDVDHLDSAALVRALKAAGIRIAGNFMIGFPNETWESVLRTKDFARELLDAGLDAVGFMIPVPYPGSIDFRTVMQNAEYQHDFEQHPLKYTDRMHWRAKPLFPTFIPGWKLEVAVQEFWEELNNSSYVAAKSERNLQ